MSEEEEENAFWKRQVDIMGLESRITELEAENKKLREALEMIRILYHEHDRTHLSLLEQAIEIAEHALKPKEEQ